MYNFSLTLFQSVKLCSGKLLELHIHIRRCTIWCCVAASSDRTITKTKFSCLQRGGTCFRQFERGTESASSQPLVRVRLIFERLLRTVF